MRARTRIRSSAAAVLVVSIACSGGDDLPKFPPSSEYAALCAVPRSGVDPWTGAPYLDRQGTLADEKTWVRSWIDELYLWYREVPNPDPATYPNVVSYFDVLKTPALTASGKPKDRFHYWWPTDAWRALAQSGVEAGYGAQWVIVANYPPRRVVAAYVEAVSPAANAAIGRGTEVLSVDGADLVYGNDFDTLNAGLFPSAAGEVHTLIVRDAVGIHEVTLTSANVESTPVPNVGTIATASGNVGYVLFNDHVATSEVGLVAAIQQLRDAQVSDLVLDLRYNGGGYLYIASELAYMIAGSARTAGKTFEQLVLNDRYGTRDPYTGEPLAPIPFFDTTLGFSIPFGAALPSLDLSRVFVLTGSGTCSASESIMNGLRGAGIQVIQVGSTTCGKPYGFVPEDNCGTTYFAIQFQGVNAEGFGSYGDGFSPGGTGPAGVPGCAVADDFTHALGDPAEARLVAALAYRATGSCSGPAASALALRTAPAEDGEVVRSPVRENRILGR
jgi:hypothetical protein